MSRNNKIKAIISTVTVLIPSVITLILWNTLKSELEKNWEGFGDNATGSGLLIALTLIPVLLAVISALCWFFTAKLGGCDGQNKKVLNMIYLLLPILSFFVSGLFYLIIFDVKFNMFMLVFAVLAVLFISFGNYMPKVRQNSTIGIKIKWTLANKENWERTHRFAGKVWFGAGIAMLFCIFLPIKAGVFAMLGAVVVAALPPVLYSYLFYKKQVANGEAGEADYTLPGGKKAVFSTVIGIVILCTVLAVIIFTGSIEATLDDDSMDITATYWSDVSIKYENIESIEYRKNGIQGYKVNGYASFKMQVGWFENEEIGRHTRYTYGTNEPCILLTVSGKPLVVSLESAEQTKALYDQLLEKTGVGA